MFTGILIARLLGPSGRGEYFLAITIIGMAQQFGTLGLHSSNVYLVAAERELFPKLAANSLLISLLVGMLAFPVMVVLLPRFFSSMDYSMAGLIAAAVGPSMYYLLMSNLLLGVDRVKEFNWYESLSRLLPLIFVGGIVAFSVLSPWLAVMANVVAVLFVVLVLACFTASRSIPKLDISLLKQGISYGLRAYLATLLSFMLSRAGGVLLGFQSDTVEMGHLSIALQLADFMIMLPATVGLVLFPRLVGTTEGRGKLTFKIVKVIGVLMMLACLVAWFFADPLIPMVFGNDFSGSVPVFRLMLPGVMALSLISVISQYLAAHGIPWQLVASWAMGLLVMILISWLYIPEFGARAVTVAMSVSYATVFVFLSYFSIRKNYSGAL